jgi:hypothetical protein
VRYYTTRERNQLDLADAMCRLILDPKISRDELKLAAEAYREAREK